MHRHSRRSFLEKLGLGAGSLLLSNVAQTLVDEAWGAVPTRKRVVFYLNTNGLNPWYNFTPKEFRKENPKDPWGPDIDEPVLGAPTTYTWPRMLKNLEPYRNRMLLCDGLANRLPNSQHSNGYGALSCVSASNGDNENGGPPGGITIDQYLANKIGAGTAKKSVLMGINKYTAEQASSVFAAGKDQPLPHLCGENVLFNSLFGSMTGPTTVVGADPNIKNHILIDSMRDDVKRLQSALAGPEKRKLEQYLSAIESFESGIKGRMMLSCNSPPKPRVANELAGNERDPMNIIEDRLESMIDMVAVALACGMTNVVGVASACGNEHSNWLQYRRTWKVDAQEYMKDVPSPVWPSFAMDGAVNDQGHAGGDEQGPAMDLIHNFHAGCIKRLVEPLMAIKEGDKSVFDNMVVMYMSDNGDAHHASHARWPFYLVGDAGGALKCDGRYVRFPISSRGMGDLFSSLATALGVPTNDFGTGGAEPVKGVISELMA